MHPIGSCFLFSNKRKKSLHVSPGAEGLLCLPFLSGERAPYWNPDARGIFFGVGLHHQRAHFIRAVMEGVLFAVYSINLALRDLAGAAQEIRASGGFARSKPWRQMMADIFGNEVLIPEVYEGSAFGAAVLAMYALGAIARLEDVEQFIRITHSHSPNCELTETYRNLFTIYEHIYNHVGEEFRALAEWQRQDEGGSVL
jgi:gluconokinase